MAEEQDNAPEAAMLNQITAAARENKVCIDLTADDDADAEDARNTSSSNNASLRTMLDPAMQMRICIDPTCIRRVTLLSAPTPTPLSTRDTPGVQIARGSDAQAVLTEAKDTHSVTAEAQQPSCTDATSGAQAQAHEPTKRKRRKRNRKNSHVPTHEVMVITGESVEERLSEEAEG